MLVTGFQLVLTITMVTSIISCKIYVVSVVLKMDARVEYT